MYSLKFHYQTRFRFRQHTSFLLTTLSVWRQAAVIEGWWTWQKCGSIKLTSGERDLRVRHRLNNEQLSCIGERCALNSWSGPATNDNACFTCQSLPVCTPHCRAVPFQTMSLTSNVGSTGFIIALTLRSMS